jgi:hypothetical protein
MLAQVLFKKVKPVVLPLVSAISSLVTAVNRNLGNPFFWLVGQVDKILDERLKQNVRIL